MKTTKKRAAALYAKMIHAALEFVSATDADVRIETFMNAKGLRAGSLTTSRHGVKKVRT